MNLGFPHTVLWMSDPYGDFTGTSPSVPHTEGNDMKPAIATTLSIAGVLAAGAAAFAVNTTVLGAAPNAVGTTIAATQTTTAAQSPTGGVAAQGADTAAVAAVTQTEAQATPVSNTTTTYQVGEAGSVVIDTASGALTVVSVMPATGWAAEPAQTLPDGSVKVHFYGSGARLEFLATMKDGKVDVAVTTDPIAKPAPTKPRDRDDDEHDDDDDHEEREREEHGDDD